MVRDEHDERVDYESMGCKIRHYEFLLLDSFFGNLQPEPKLLVTVVLDSTYPALHFLPYHIL
jgi:hypothetical protein